MTFKVTVAYQVHDGKVLTKEMTGVEKVERAFERINGESTEIVTIKDGVYTAATWMAGSILHISMIPERG